VSLGFGQVPCPSNVATLVVPAVNANLDGSVAAAGGRRQVTIANYSAQTIYLGDSTVSSANGFALATNQTVVLLLSLADAVYGRGASATPTVSWIEGGV
jgi:hypothetical protein